MRPIVRPARFLAPAALLACALVAAGCPSQDWDDEDAPTGRPLSSAEVTRGLSARDLDVRACVTRARDRIGAVSGRMEVAGTIGTDGRVREVRVTRSGTDDQALQDCILGEVRLARFEAAGAETEFTHAFDLGPATARQAEWQPDDEPAAPAARDDATGEAVPFRQDAIDALAERESAAIEACYRGRAEADPDLAGRVELAWAVTPRGVVQSVVVTESTLNDEAVESCIVRNVRGWRFEAPGGTGLHQARYAWNFSQEREEVPVEVEADGDE